MTLINWNNRNRTSLPTINHFLGNFVNELGNTVGNDGYYATPAVNILENEHAFTVEVAAPGLNRDAFNIQLEAQKLIISADTEAKENSPKYKRQEFNFKKFSRTFRLPSTIDGEHISAKYEDGILTITLPKREEVKPRAIEVN